MGEAHFGNTLKKYCPYVLGSMLFIYVVIRAIILPVTHDESNTCLVYSTMSVKDIITYKIPIPNNHIFNTLLIKLSTFLFGWSNLSVRLPNVLGFLLYYFSVLALLRKISSDFLFTLFGLIIMTFNPFLLDFYSMARGYALATSFMMASILFAVRYLENASVKSLFIALLFAAIGVYTNFTLLNYYAAFIGLLGMLILQEAIGKYLLQKLMLMAIVTLILGALSYIPIQKMLATNQFRFWKPGGFYSGTVKTLIESSLYDSNAVHFPIPVVSVLLGVLFVILSILILRSLWYNNTLRIRKHYQIFYLLLTGTVIVNIAHFYIAETPYLSGRTALFYIPLFTINIIGFVACLAEKKVRLIKFTMPLGMSLVAIHFMTALNMDHCYEWSYDKNTYDVIAFLKEEHKRNGNKPVTLSTNWLFYPSFRFYIETEKLSWLKLEDFHNVIRPESSCEYYYTVSAEVKSLESNYSKILSYDKESRILMKKKGGEIIKSNLPYSIH